ncbi:MAG TPA: Hsp20/alpha crystallin family protein, partial [Pyrinomonadaceae bacterium]|nr:Hsp20/alpha crystallin family protein [Pyrinomonadaceae bacterium]
HLCSERAYGHFNRAVPLRWPVRANEATASLCGGVLTVRLPKLSDRRGASFQIMVKDDSGE